MSALVLNALVDGEINLDLIASDASSGGMERHSFSMDSSNLANAQITFRPALGFWTRSVSLFG